MTDLRAQMIAEARARHGEVLPCASRSSLEECFTQERGLLMLWYNSADGNTHLVRRNIQAGGGFPDTHRGLPPASRRTFTPPAFSRRQPCTT